MKTNILGLTIEELKAYVSELGEKPFRAKQLFTWLHSGTADFNEMTNLSKAFREKLAENAVAGGVSVIDEQIDRLDGTRKFLFGLEDGNAVEGVFMKYKYGNSLCISSQVGCKMGCVFCASALGGFVRHLSAGEMLGEVFAAERQTGELINHIVVMGMGEPFDNYENLSRFLQLIHDPQGKNLSYRNITVSTSGIIPKIEKFSEDFPQVNLAISLHRLDSEDRSRLMPVNKSYPLEKLLDAAKKYADKTGRRVTFEYALIHGENDRNEDVELMKNKLSDILCHVNLIPLNKVEETGLEGSSRRRAKEIEKQLNDAGIPATVRRELGDEIDGACGQLRLRKAHEM